MKRFLLITLACACIFSFSACNNTPDQPEETLPQATEAPETNAPATEAPATEAPVTEAPATEAPATEAPATDSPEPAAENSISVDGLTFEYPAGWEMISEAQAIDLTTGTNVNVVSEPKNVFYDTMDAEVYTSATKPIYDAAGLTITDVSVEHLENSKGVKVVKVGFTAEMAGFSMRMTQLIVHSGDKTCTVTVTETTPAEGLVDFVFESITVK